MVERLVFIAPPTRDGSPGSGPIPRSVVVAGLAALAVLAWWLFVTPAVQRPSTAIWCPEGSERFDAREVLGRTFEDGYDLARRHGCTVQDIDGDRDAMGRSNRINVEITRDTITRIDSIG